MLSDTQFVRHNHVQFGEIRTLIDDKGEPWFIAKDIAEAIGFKNPSDATKYLDADESTLINNPSGTGGSKATIINESGLYHLIFNSRKPEAKAFRKWVTSEVLPSIRKHGVYRKEKPAEPEGLSEKSFIEHDGCFWLDTVTIAKELSRYHKNATHERLMGIMHYAESSINEFITVFNNKKYVRDEGIYFVSILSADKDALEFCKVVRQMLESLNGKDLSHVKIAAVRAYQEIVSRLNSSGRDINFVRSLIRYKEKDLNPDEIAILTGYSRDDIAVYLEELDSSGIIEMAELLSAVPDTMPASATAQCLPSAVTFATPTREMIKKLGYNEAVVINQLQTMIQESGKKRIQITYADWMKRFPFKSEKTLRRTIRKLEKQGIIQARQITAHSQRIKEYWIDPK